MDEDVRYSKEYVEDLEFKVKDLSEHVIKLNKQIYCAKKTSEIEKTLSELSANICISKNIVSLLNEFKDILKLYSNNYEDIE